MQETGTVEATTPTTTPQTEPTETAPTTPEPVTEPAAVASLAVEDIAPPEGFELDDSLRGKFVEVYNNADLTPAERANALIEMHAETLRTASEKISEDWTNLRSEWADSARNDPEFGGDKFDGNMAQIAKLLNEFGDPALREEVFDITGAGDHPLMFKFLSRIAKAMGEGGPVLGTAPAGDKPSLAQRLYPSMKE